MNRRSLFLILLVVLVWGLNFVVISVGVKEVPPFFMAGLRFAFLAFPLVLFLPKPNIPFRWLAAYGLTISFGQFACLFYALSIGMPSGQASLVLQSQVFVTALLGVILYQDRLNGLQIFGGLCALAGIGLLLYGVLETNISMLGYLFTFAAACSWGIGNLCNRTISTRYPGTSMMQLVVWGAVLPTLPFFLTSYFLEDHQHIIEIVSHPSVTAMLSLAYLILAASLFGYTAWGVLISKHGTANVVPFALLVPVVGLLSGWIFLGETLNLTQALGCLIVIMGLAIYSFHQQLKQALRGTRSS